MNIKLYRINYEQTIESVFENEDGTKNQETREEFTSWYEVDGFFEALNTLLKRVTCKVKQVQYMEVNVNPEQILKLDELTAENGELEEKCGELEERVQDLEEHLENINRIKEDLSNAVYQARCELDELDNLIECDLDNEIIY